jgi:autotransporter-associated beta strand protein/T5SS/PEP-CTERM-associated repeat protein
MNRHRLAALLASACAAASVSAQVAVTGDVTTTNSTPVASPSWDLSSETLFVGNTGTGSLTISDDTGNVSTSAVIIGNEAGSVGTVTVSGGSLINSGSTIQVGSSGSQGTLTVSGTGLVQTASQIDVGSSGTINLNGGILSASRIFGSPTSAVVFDGGTFRPRSAISSAFTNFGPGGVTLNGGGGTIDTQNFSSSITQALVGVGSLTKQGTGFLRLSGVNTYTGATNVAAGVLQVNGSLAADSAVTVASGATLRGTGTIGGTTTVQSGGTLDPGVSLGLLTFGSSLTLGSGATASFSIDGDGRGTTYDAVNVAGLSTYGGTLSLAFGGAIADGTTLDLFGLTGGSAGDFDFITASGSYTGSFTNNGGVWKLESGGQTLTFTESTGDLGFAGAAIPEPGTTAAFAGLATLTLAALRRRRAV